jgi:flavin-dependent dehydrogenase
MGGFMKVLEASSPALRACVERAHLNGRLRGFGGTPGFLRPCQGPGWALVGDAGYFKDPLTAHGITDALRDAALLSRAILAGHTQALVAYQTSRDALSLQLLRITDEMASFTWDFDELKRLHKTLSDCMKVETTHLADLSRTPRLAA